MFAEFFTPEQIAILTQIILIDLVLAGDNAIIIGMVASKFPIEQRKKVIFWGIGGAVILRIILTLLTAYLLQITGLRLIGGLLLLYIVYKLYVDVIKGSETDEASIDHDDTPVTVPDIAVDGSPDDIAADATITLRRMSKSALLAELPSPKHKASHFPHNPYCETCRIANMRQKTFHRRTERADDELPAIKAP